MNPITVVTIVSGVVVLIVLLILQARRRERERTEELRRVAETAGLSFQPKAELAAVRSLGEVQLFSRGHSKRVTNLMAGRIGDRDVAVFDYQYSVGSGKHRSTTWQTVVMLPRVNPELPDFQMAPENPFTKLAEVFGYQDIDIDSSPEFSARYIVRGADEAAIRAALYPRATSFFADHQGWTVEVQSGTVALYRGNRQVKADQVRMFIDEATTAALNL